MHVRRVSEHIQLETRHISTSEVKSPFCLHNVSSLALSETELFTDAKEDEFSNDGSSLSVRFMVNIKASEWPRGIN